MIDNGQIDKQMGRYMDGQVDTWMKGQMGDLQMNGCIDEQMDEQRWMYR